MAKNNLKVSTNGDVCVLAVGRRTITTANAYQKMVKPNNGGLSSWNSFVRVYDSQFRVPKYSSLIVGVWDTLTQAGGDNTEMFGVYKTNLGVICVGRQKADSSGMPIGNNIPVVNVTPWGSATPQNESAVLVYYQATNLNNENDSIITGINQTERPLSGENILLFPNPAQTKINVSLNVDQEHSNLEYRIIDMFGNIVRKEKFNSATIDISTLDNGIYQFQLSSKSTVGFKKFIILR